MRNKSYFGLALIGGVALGFLLSISFGYCIIMTSSPLAEKNLILSSTSLPEGYKLIRSWRSSRQTSLRKEGEAEIVLGEDPLALSVNGYIIWVFHKRIIRCYDPRTGLVKSYEHSMDIDTMEAAGGGKINITSKGNIETLLISGEGDIELQTK